MRERSFECGLHLHLLELGDGEVEVGLCLGLLCVVACEEQFGEAEGGQGLFGS